tara:strand:+ start:427 stop:591 length:165 start_codon:yes stop_codon:yes gene_type:complete
MSLALVILTVAAFVAMNYPYRGSKAVLLAASIIHAGCLIGWGIIFMRYLTALVL